jgi:predicted small secreted protein
MLKKSSLFGLFSVLALSGVLAACEDRNEGPAEKVGEAVEDAGEEMKDAVD